MKNFAAATIAVAVAAMAAFGLAGSFGTARAGSQPTSDPLSALPDGIGAVVVDIGQMTASSAWATLSGPGKTAHAIHGVESDLEDLGLKLSDLKQAAISFSKVSTNDSVIVISGNLNQNDLLSRLRANPKVKLTSESYKNFEIYRAVNTSAGSSKSGDVTFAFLDAATAALGTTGGVKSAIDVHTGDKPGIAANPIIEGALSQTAAAAIRFAFAPPEGAFASTESSKLPLPDMTSVKLIFGTIGVNAGIDINATLRNDTAEHAQAMAAQLNGLLAMAKGFLGSSSSTSARNSSIGEALKTIAINSTGADVTVTGAVSPEVLGKLIH
ncbi:MAG TPA: hypothetical protein VJX67_23050 [Blastocatellia bacterium]|nr:hypothetical protein [Blastocatellia bacterium]